MKRDMHQSTDNHFIPITSVASGTGHEIRDDVFYFTNQIVNVVFFGKKNSRDWVLIDAGMPNSSSKILDVAAKRFGVGNKPLAIILTHGHFDHVGAIVDLITEWKVPVFAHLLEFPYLTGQMDYPEPDTSVEGGLLAKLSFVYPHKATDIQQHLLPLPLDGSVPFMPGWRWLHTPGHSPGHVSLFRESDKTLVAGDAFLTVRVDSLYKVLFQKQEVNGPPRYLTTNWQTAYQSVKLLNDLEPKVAITGHGEAMQGEDLRNGLAKLVSEFDKLALPKHGEFVQRPQ